MKFCKAKTETVGTELLGEPRYSDESSDLVEHTPAGVHFQQLTTTEEYSVVRLQCRKMLIDSADRKVASAP